MSPDVQASPAEGLQEHPSLAVTAGSLCWAGLGKALQSAGGRAEHKCPQGHYGAAQEMATTPRTWRQGHGADPFSLKASFPGARGPPPPGEGESTLGSGKPLPAASVQKPRAPSQPLPAPLGPTVLEPVAVAKHVLQSLPLQPLSAELGPCPSRTTASEMGNR